MDSTTLCQYHDTFRNLVKLYDVKVQYMTQFIKDNEFNDPYMSHPYSFATYQEFKDISNELHDLFLKIQELHMTLMAF